MAQLEEAIKKIVREMIENEEIKIEIDDGNQIYLTTDEDNLDDEDIEENEEESSEDEEEDEE